ncbi:hypothetical protein Tco_0138586 [Tanacetum coccineum]
MMRHRDIWLAVKARFGGNEESKKMRKTMLKQQFTEFSVTEEEGLHKGYDRFQKILSQLNQVQARPDNDESTRKVSYEHLLLHGHKLVGTKNKRWPHHRTLNQVETLENGRNGLKVANAITPRINRFEKKAGRKMNYNNHQPADLTEGKLAELLMAAESSKNLDKLINSSMSTRTKVGLGFKEYFGENEVFDLSRPSTMYPEPVEQEKTNSFSTQRPKHPVIQASIPRSKDIPPAVLKADQHSPILQVEIPKLLKGIDNRKDGLKRPSPVSLLGGPGDLSTDNDIRYAKTTIPTGTQAQDSDSYVEDRNYAEELAKAQRQEYERKDSFCTIWLFVLNKQQQKYYDKPEAIFETKCFCRWLRYSAGHWILAGGYFLLVVLLLVVILLVYSYLLVIFQPAVVMAPADQGRSFCPIHRFLADLIPVHADESTLPPGQGFGLDEVKVPFTMEKLKKNESLSLKALKILTSQSMITRVVKISYGLHQAPRSLVKQLPDGIFISQDKYVKDMLTKFDMESVRTATTPYEAAKTKLKDETDPPVNVHLYRSMIGSLMYLTASRPDIMFAVSACSRHQVTPLTSHLNAVKKIFKYLKGQPKLGLWYPKDSPFQLEAYSDSDYAGSHGDRKSTTGGCQFLGRRLISWQCKKQTIVATSSTEAEYVAAASCCAQVLKIHTDDNVADLLTKAFDGPRFEYLVVHIGMVDMVFCGILFSCDCRVCVPAVCMVSAVGCLFLLAEYIHAAGVVYAANTSIYAAELFDIAGWLVSATSHLVSAGSLQSCWCHNVSAA